MLTALWRVGGEAEIMYGDACRVRGGKGRGKNGEGMEGTWAGILEEE